MTFADFTKWQAIAVLTALSVGCGDDGDSGDDAADDDGGSSGAGTGDVPEGCDLYVQPSDDDQAALQGAFIDAAEGQTVCLSEGTFTFTRQLSLDAAGVTVQGAGQDATILDFTGQISGGNGILISADDVTFTELTVKNTPGDGIRADQVSNIAFIRVTVGWDAEASLENGAYGLYPVQTTGVLVQECTVYGARDAGIYVGQSSDIVVEDSESYGNVAGIEIENSRDASVRRNHAHDNTAGFLVFNLPGLDVLDGQRTNAYDNVFENNNVPNFAEGGTVVASLPYGIGALILAADNNEFADNTITGNNSMGIGVIAYVEALFPPPSDPDYDIYAQGNFIHDNTFSGNGSDPDSLVQLLTDALIPSPDILLDGCFDEELDNSDGALTNCLSGNIDATYMQVNVCGQQAATDMDLEAATCEHDLLPRE